MSLRKITGTSAHLAKIKIAEYYIQLEKNAGGVINLDRALEDLNNRNHLVPEEELGQLQKDISSLKDYLSSNPCREIDRLGYIKFKASQLSESKLMDSLEDLIKLA